MKKECQEFLTDYVNTHVYGKTADYDFFALFKLFSAYEIHCKADIKPAIQEFYEFLLSMEKFIIIKSNIYNPPRLIEQAANVLNRFFKSTITKSQKGFAKIVKELAPNKKETSILEVGAGMFPRSSIYMAESMDKITALDKDFIVSQATLQGMNVSSIETTFNASTQVKDFDFVVGRFPCSAIPHIVSQCKKENKPYFIELCDCALTATKNKEAKMLGWQGILPEKDENVKFHLSYAYNIDATKSQIASVIEKFRISSADSDSAISL